MNIQRKSPFQRINHYLYNPNDKLGQGATGKVYRGINQSNEQCVAIKILQMTQIDNQVTKYLLSCQKQALRTISNPFVLYAHDIFQTDQQCFIITPYCNGGTLKNSIKLSGKYPQTHALKIFNKILKGYLSIKHQGFIHRDLKSSNIMFKNGQPIIIDFGYCQKLTGNKPKIFYNVGSPSYMSPQAYFHTIYSQKSDIWALGIILYQMLQGHTIDQGCTIERYFHFLAKQGFALKSQISDFTKKTLNITLSQNPSNRPTVQYLLQNIERYITQNSQQFQKQQFPIPQKISLKKIQNKNQQIKSSPSNFIQSNNTSQQIFYQQKKYYHHQSSNHNPQSYHSMQFAQNANVDGFDQNFIKMSQSIYSRQANKTQKITTPHPHPNTILNNKQQIQHHQKIIMQQNIQSQNSKQPPPYLKQPPFLKIAQQQQQNFPNPHYQYHQSLPLQNYQQQVKYPLNFTILQQNNTNQNVPNMKKPLTAVHNPHPYPFPQNPPNFRQSLNIKQSPTHLPQSSLQHQALIQSTPNQKPQSFNPSPQSQHQSFKKTPKIKTLSDAQSILTICTNYPQNDGPHINNLNNVELINSFDFNSPDTCLKNSINSQSSNQSTQNINQNMLPTFPQPPPKPMTPIVQSLIVEPNQINSHVFQNQQNMSMQIPLQNRINTPKPIYRSAILPQPIFHTNYPHNFTHITRPQTAIPMQINTQNQITSGIPIILTHQPNQKIILQKNPYNIFQTTRPLSSVQNSQRYYQSQHLNPQKPIVQVKSPEIQGNFFKKSQPYNHHNIQQNFNQNNQNIKAFTIINKIPKSPNQMKFASINQNIPILKTQLAYCRPNIITNIPNPQLPLRIPIVQHVVTPGYA